MTHGNNIPGYDILQGMHIRGWCITYPRCLEDKPLIPVLLILPGNTWDKAVKQYFGNERTEDRPEGILEAFYEYIGSQDIDGMAVRAPQAFDPQGLYEPFKISLYISVTPDTG